MGGMLIGDLRWNCERLETPVGMAARGTGRGESDDRPTVDKETSMSEPEDQTNIRDADPLTAGAAAGMDGGGIGAVLELDTLLGRGEPAGGRRGRAGASPRAGPRRAGGRAPRKQRERRRGWGNARRRADRRGPGEGAGR